MSRRGLFSPLHGAHGRQLASRGLALACTLFISIGCFRFGYDAGGDPGSGGSFGGLVNTAQGFGGSAPLFGTEGSGDSELLPFARDAAWLPGHPWTASGGALAASSPDGGTAGAAGNTDAGPGGTNPGQACRLGNQRTVQQFDAPTSLVTARGGNASVSWTGSEGNPAPGALDFRNPGGGTAELFSGSLTGNLTQHVMLLNVELAAGSNVRVRLFVETGTQARRGNGAYLSPELGQWDCASLDLDAPDTVDTSFDARNVTGAGLQVEGSGSVELYLDQIAY